MKVIFIADAFVDQTLGGGELNNHEVILELQARNHEVIKTNSYHAACEYIEKNSGSFFIISNFLGLPESSKRLLKHEKYIIYEHDHKYLRCRYPVEPHCKNLKCPPSEIINLDFYLNAKAVLCQSKFHQDVMKKNIDVKNIVNLGGNLWSLSSLERMRQISKIEKKDRCSILGSNTIHKNMIAAIKYCEFKNLNYDVLGGLPYKQFIEKFGLNKTFCFFPKTPETLSRLVVEARMMNMGVITNKTVGAIYEPWYSLKGGALIDVMIKKRQEIINKIEKIMSS